MRRNCDSQSNSKVWKILCDGLPPVFNLAFDKNAACRIAMPLCLVCMCKWESVHMHWISHKKIKSTPNDLLPFSLWLCVVCYLIVFVHSWRNVKYYAYFFEHFGLYSFEIIPFFSIFFPLHLLRLNISQAAYSVCACIGCTYAYVKCLFNWMLMNILASNSLNLYIERVFLALTTILLCSPVSTFGPKIYTTAIPKDKKNKYLKKHTKQISKNNTNKKWVCVCARDARERETGSTILIKQQIQIDKQIRTSVFHNKIYTCHGL